MDLAKPGEIKHHCDPNGLSSFQEYLLDYAGPETQAAGLSCIEDTLQSMAEQPRLKAQGMLDQVRKGDRDVFC
jgi:2-iminoacetate synthase